MSDFPLTVAEIREKRFRRDVARYKSEADRAAWEMREIKAEYKRVTEIYTRHLERLDKNAARPGRSEEGRRVLDPTRRTAPEHIG